VGQALEVGLLINVTAERVIRLLPPLIIDQDQATLLVEGLCPLIRRFLNTH
jgi:acetylornithine aminotransferase